MPLPNSLLTGPDVPYVFCKSSVPSGAYFKRSMSSSPPALKLLVSPTT